MYVVEVGTIGSFATSDKQVAVQAYLARRKAFPEQTIRVVYSDIDTGDVDIILDSSQE